MALPVNQDTEFSNIFAHYKSDFQTVKHLHESNENPREILRELTEITDTLVIRTLLQYLQRVLDADEMPSNMLLLAQGGYGRRELQPKSDVDILFLYNQSLDENQSELVKKVFQTLFDFGFKVGHACRSFRQAYEIAANDPQTQSALIETRFLAGDWRLFENFKTDLWRTLNRRHKERIRRKIRERADRRARYGTTINITEPNLKESPGGLRDYHFGLWLGSLHSGRTMNLLQLKRSQLIDDSLYNRVEKALEFHWRLRNDLHFMTGKQQDVLILPLQHQISTRLGYQDIRGRLSEEEMMREYYTHALSIEQFAEHMVHRCMPRPLWAYFVPKPSRGLSDGMAVVDNRLHLPQDIHYFEHNPQRMLKAFIHCAEQRIPLSEEAKLAIHDNLDLIDQAFLHDKNNAGLIRRFFSIDRNIEPAVHEMRTSGFLERLFPEWRTIVFLVRYDLVHRYTVDEHSLLCLYHLENLYKDELHHSEDRHQLWMACSDKDVLRLAVLFHDIGKGRSGDHSIIGAGLVDDIARRMRLSERKRKRLIFLVRHHLIMSHTAQHRDLSDPQVTADFCDTIEDLETLAMLYLLTYVDLRSVSPESMTEWKNNLLWQLYGNAWEIFISDAEPESAEHKIVLSRKEEVTHQLSRTFDRKLVAAHLNTLPPSYLMYQTAEQIQQHLEALQDFDGTRPIARLYPHVDPGCFNMVMVWKDQLGLFNRICSAVMVENFSIVEARLNTRGDGLAVNNIIISDKLSEQPTLSENRQRLLLERIDRVLLSSEPPPQLPKSPHKVDVGRNRFETQIRVLNDISMRYTIVEVRCPDRWGLLQNLTAIFYEMALSIHFARIITEGSRVTDIFYISDAEGNKLSDKQSIEELKRALHQQASPALQNA